MFTHCFWVLEVLSHGVEIGHANFAPTVRNFPLALFLVAHAWLTDSTSTCTELSVVIPPPLCWHDQLAHQEHEALHIIPLEQFRNR